MQQKFCNVLGEGGWSENCRWAGDRDTWIDLRYPRVALKEGDLLLVMSRNWPLNGTVKLLLVAPCAVMAAAISLWEKRQYHKTPDVGMRCAVLTSLAL